LKAIAQDAGVGIGTLYRRFPTREHLVWAIYRREVERICDSVPDLLATHAPVTALRTWMDEFVDLLVAKRGMAESLKAALARNDSQRLETRRLLTGALATLIGAGTEEGTLRADVSPLDVMMALGGTALIAGEPDQHQQATRLLDLLMDGLRPIGGPTTVAG
jgi:AcrR family transcriptional regulator